MALNFHPLNDKDTKELRKEIGLPVTKDIVYWYKDSHYCWQQCNVVDYEIVETYMPSGSKSILITLEEGEQLKILSDYLADMQKSSFLNDVGCEGENQNSITGKCGKRIESNVDTYVVVDLETTGTNHIKDEIIEVGAIKYLLGKEIERFGVLIRTNVKIPAKIKKLTGISNDMLANQGLEPQEALEQFKKFVGESITVGHNFTTFDSKFLEDAYVKYLNCHFPNDFIDTFYLAKKVFPDWKHHKLENLAEEYNIDYTHAHRALEDCVINHLVYEYLTFGCLLSEEISDSSAVDVDDKKQTINEDELIEVEFTDGWRAKISARFLQLQSEFGLMDNSFSIMANLGKEGKISSYAICVYEPDLVENRRDNSRNTVLARIKEGVLKSNPNILEVYSKYFENKDGKNRFEKDSKELIDCLVECIQFGINNYIPKAATFACCSRYEDCSKEKKCIHPNILYAKACQYRKNLENGNVFY